MSINGSRRKSKNVSFGEPRIKLDFSEVPSPETADQYFYEGRLNEAAQVYTEILNQQEQPTVTDVNNNDVFESTSNISWTEDYLESKNKEIDRKLELDPKEASYYLEKAAVLFFKDKWGEGRETLAQGLSKCQNKSELRATLGNLNKLERSIANLNLSN